MCAISSRGFHPFNGLRRHFQPTPARLGLSRDIEESSPSRCGGKPSRPIFAAALLAPIFNGATTFICKAGNEKGTTDSSAWQEIVDFSEITEGERSTPWITRSLIGSICGPSANRALANLGIEMLATHTLI